MQKLAVTTNTASPYSRDNVRKGLLHYLLGRGVSAIAGFATIILLVRHMPVGDYAAYTALLGVSVVAGMLGGLGMERALTRYIPEGRLHHSQRELAFFIWMTTLVRLTAMSVVVAAISLLWPILAGHTGDVSGGPFPVSAVFLILATTMFQLLSSVMQALVLQKMLTRVMVVQWGGRLALILALLSTETHIELKQAIWLMTIPDALGSVILAGVIHRYLAALKQEASHNDAAADSWPQWSEVRRLSLDNYGYNLVAALPQGSAMILIAAAMLAAPFVAAYGFFINLLDRLKQYLPLQFMLNLAEPVLIAAYVRDRDFGKLSHHNRLLYQCNLLFLMPALASVLAVGAQLTGLLTGGKYQQQGWILAVLLIQLALGSHATILQIIINAVGKSNVLRWSGGAALLALCMTLALVTFGGGENAPLYLVAAPLVYEAVNNLIGVVLLRRQGYAYDVGWVFHGKLLGASFIAYFCAQLAAREFDVQVLQVLAAGVVAVSSFIAAILLLRVLDARDMDVLRTLLRRETKA